MNKTDQLSFLGFEAAPAAAQPVKGPGRKKHVSLVTQALPTTGMLDSLVARDTAVLDVSAMAQQVSQHPDYRVLRRLVPCTDYGPVAATGTQRVIVLDTETTGLDARHEKIIELAMLSVLVDTATGLPVGPVTVFESFEDPGKPIPPQITEITGIDDSMVQGQRIDDSTVTALVAQADLVVAHNAGFDRPFVEARWPIFASKAWNCSFAGIDWKKEGSGSAKLEFLASERGWFYDAHRAQVDCHALLQILSTPLRDGMTGLSRLVAGLGQTRYKLRATGAPFDAKDKLKSRGYRWDAEGRVWWCSLPSDELLQAECTWLRDEVYGQRGGRVQLEAMDSHVQFSSRPGQLSEKSI
jgi:DNA polymerase-3 subunit epsilon